jgi:osmotically-inducible protein OsmY
VTNVITVKPKVEPSELQRKIMEAFKRNAEVDASRVTVEANGSEVILKGTVRSWIEREEVSPGRRPASPRSKSGSSVSP